MNPSPTPSRSHEYPADRWVWRSVAAAMLTLAAGLVALGVVLYAP
jgi:hypothetical protein